MHSCAAHSLISGSRLNGYIAGPNGEADWIVTDPDVDVTEVFGQFDTLLIGRRTFEFMLRHGQTNMPGMQIFVFSHTLRQRDYPHVTIVSEAPATVVNDLRTRPGKDIWLFGGGELFRTLLEAGLVDSVEVSIVPVLLGAGAPLLPAPALEYAIL
jgi:dihydrofolate reductase